MNLIKFNLIKQNKIKKKSPTIKKKLNKIRKDELNDYYCLKAIVTRFVSFRFILFYFISWLAALRIYIYNK